MNIPNCEICILKINRVVSQIWAAPLVQYLNFFQSRPCNKLSKLFLLLLVCVHMRNRSSQEHIMNQPMKWLPCKRSWVFYCFIRLA